MQFQHRTVRGPRPGPTFTTLVLLTAWRLSAQTPWDVEPLLTGSSTLWERSPQSFLETTAEHGFGWNPRTETAFSSCAVRFGALGIRQSGLRFVRGRPVSWAWTVHDHASHGDVATGWLREQFVQATNEVQRWAGSEPMPAARPDGGHALVWGRPPHIVSVEWSMDPDVPTALWELRLVAEPWPPRRDWRANVRSATNGDHALTNVPMVDQVLQGYCAPATVERVMRYYGIPLQASAMARLAESSTDTGTNVERMLSQIRQLRGMGCTVREIFGFDVARFERTIRDYNAAAVGTGRPALNGQTPVLNLAQAFADADADLLRTVSGRQSERRAFWREVRRTVDAGLPLVWGVVLGIVPEPGVARQTRGGHLRLIIGYNEETQEILFSDPWGPGHELKRMPLGDAWSTTMSLHVLVPLP